VRNAWLVYGGHKEIYKQENDSFQGHNEFFHQWREMGLYEKTVLLGPQYCFSSWGENGIMKIGH
jgi:hypothetical protein